MAVTKKTYLYWPIKLEWRTDPSCLISWFCWHGWQAGWKEFSHGIFGWTFHLGRLIVVFGKELPRHKAKIIQFPERAA